VLPAAEGPRACPFRLERTNVQVLPESPSRPFRVWTRSISTERTIHFFRNRNGPARPSESGVAGSTRPPIPGRARAGGARDDMTPSRDGRGARRRDDDFQEPADAYPRPMRPGPAMNDRSPAASAKLRDDPGQATSGIVTCITETGYLVRIASGT
jgi:hypothetical protein